MKKLVTLLLIPLLLGEPICASAQSVLDVPAPKLAPLSTTLMASQAMSNLLYFGGNPNANRRFYKFRHAHAALYRGAYFQGKGMTVDEALWLYGGLALSAGSYYSLVETHSSVSGWIGMVLGISAVLVPVVRWIWRQHTGMPGWVIPKSDLGGALEFLRTAHRAALAGNAIGEWDTLLKFKEELTEIPGQNWLGISAGKAHLPLIGDRIQLGFRKNVPGIEGTEKYTIGRPNGYQLRRDFDGALLLKIPKFGILRIETTKLESKTERVQVTRIDPSVAKRPSELGALDSLLSLGMSSVLVAAALAVKFWPAGILLVLALAVAASRRTTPTPYDLPQKGFIQSLRSTGESFMSGFWFTSRSKLLRQIKKHAPGDFAGFVNNTPKGKLNALLQYAPAAVWLFVGNRMEWSSEAFWAMDALWKRDFPELREGHMPTEKMMLDALAQKQDQIIHNSDPSRTTPYDDAVRAVKNAHFDSMTPPEPIHGSLAEIKGIFLDPKQESDLEKELPAIIEELRQHPDDSFDRRLQRVRDMVVRISENLSYLIRQLQDTSLRTTDEENFSGEMMRLLPRSSNAQFVISLAFGRLLPLSETETREWMPVKDKNEVVEPISFRRLLWDITGMLNFHASDHKTLEEAHAAIFELFEFAGKEAWFPFDYGTLMELVQRMADFEEMAEDHVFNFIVETHLLNGERRYVIRESADGHHVVAGRPFQKAS